MHGLAASIAVTVRRVAVSVGLNDTDDHLRNHGFPREHGGWSLSPAFDVNPNPDPDGRRTTILGPDAGPAQAAGLRELAAMCRLSPSALGDVLADVLRALDDWRAVATRNGVPPSQCARFERVFTAGRTTLMATQDS